MAEIFNDETFFNLKVNLLSSHLFFTQFFYKVRYNRDFVISNPVGRESHFSIISNALTRTFTRESRDLIIAAPPRYGKTELIIHFIAWAMAWYPDSNFIYVSYAANLAKKFTSQIRDIIDTPIYRDLFDVRLRQDNKSKAYFETTAGGSVFGVGAGGPITGMGAGILGANRYAGGIFMDDIIKPQEALSDVIRAERNEWYFNTLISRKNDSRTPIIANGQRTHEEDIQGNLILQGGWENISIPALDEANNALYPEKHTTQDLLRMKELTPYVFASQYQQNPIPDGCAIFREEWFRLMDEAPEILHTFITVDTAETDKNYNDATVFSFWGVYRIYHGTTKTDMYGLHWIDCREMRIEPADLYHELLQFYYECLRFKVKPKTVAIEKKSTGVTLISSLRRLQGIDVVDINRTKVSGNKAARYLEAQGYVSGGQISLTRYAKHTKMCLGHCSKITANDSHAHDDIADTLYDAVKLSLIDEYFKGIIESKGTSNVIKTLTQQFNHQEQLRSRAYASSF